MYKHLHALEKHPESLICFTISSDGKALVSSCYDMIKVWDIEEGTLICSHKLNKYRHLHFSLVISPDWTTFVTDYDKHIEIHDLLTGSQISDFRIENRSSIAIHPNGKTLITGGCGHITSEQQFIPIRFYDLQTGKLVHILRGHERSVSSVIVSPDGKSLVSQSHHFSVKVWNLSTGQELCSFHQPPRRWVDTVAFLGSLDIVASGCRFNGNEIKSNDWNELQLEVWNIMTDEVIYSFPKSPRRYSPYPPGEPRSVMTPDGKTLVSGNDIDVVVWDLQLGERLYTLQRHKSKVENLAIAPNGTMIASYAEDSIHIWKQQ